MERQILLYVGSVLFIVPVSIWQAEKELHESIHMKLLLYNCRDCLLLLVNESVSRCSLYSCREYYPELQRLKDAKVQFKQLIGFLLVHTSGC